MEETIKIQEEFESLLEQLKRLRSINDITSTNVESANKVISEVDNFVHSAKEFKAVTEADFNQKSEKIDRLLSELNKSVSKIDSEAQHLSSSINKSFQEFKTLTSDELQSDISDLKAIFQESVERTNALKSEINNALMAHRVLVLESIGKSKDENLKEIKSLQQKIISTNNSVIKAIDFLNTKTLEVNSATIKAISFNKAVIVLNAIVTFILLGIVLFSK